MSVLGVQSDEMFAEGIRFPAENIDNPLTIKPKRRLFRPKWLYD